MANQQPSATTTAEITVRETQPDAYRQFLLTRALVGIIGLLLPLVLSLVGLRLGVPVQNSLSAYYHTAMGDYFVGSLFAIGTGLLVYMATRANLVDNLISIAAGIFAIMVALFFTNEEGTDPTMISIIHFVSAALLIISLAVICFRFARVDKLRADRGDRQKFWWPLLHTVAGVVITLAVIYAGFGALDEDRGWEVSIFPRRYLLLAEWVAVYAFAISWALKGSEILSYYRGRDNHHLRQDRPNPSGLQPPDAARVSQTLSR